MEVREPVISGWFSLCWFIWWRMGSKHSQELEKEAWGMGVEKCPGSLPISCRSEQGPPGQERPFPSPLPLLSSSSPMSEAITEQVGHPGSRESVCVVLLCIARQPGQPEEIRPWWRPRRGARNFLSGEQNTGEVWFLPQRRDFLVVRQWFPDFEDILYTNVCVSVCSVCTTELITYVCHKTHKIETKKGWTETEVFLFPFLTLVDVLTLYLGCEHPPSEIPQVTKSWEVSDGTEPSQGAPGGEPSFSYLTFCAQFRLTGRGKKAFLGIW